MERNPYQSYRRRGYRESSRRVTRLGDENGATVAGKSERPR